jgi:uridine kinase
VPDYDRRTSRIQGGIVLRPRPFLIVEGLFVLFEKRLSEHLDLAIFLEVDPAVQLSRRLKRDVLEYGMSPERVHDTYEGYVVPAYAEFVAPTRGAADLIVPGSTSINDLLARVMTHL